MAQKLKSRSWTWTWFAESSDDNDMKIKNAYNYKYLVFGREKCGTTGREHYQGYSYHTNAVSATAFKKKLPGIHLELPKGNAIQNRAYCIKENDYYEGGVMPEQGKRVDLDELRDEIVDGLDPEDICMDRPELYHQYGRTFNKIHDICMRKKVRTEMTKGIWIYGPTSTGKSERAFKDYTPDTHYLLPHDGGWWDAYKQQDTVIINDFRGHIPYNELLQMIDKWPYSVKRRGREPLPFISKTIIITSSLSPQAIYRNRMEEDSIEQLLRRIDIVHTGQPVSIELDNFDT